MQESILDRAHVIGVCSVNLDRGVRDEQLQTALGTLIVFKSGTTFEIIKFGDLSMKIATGFTSINEVGEWVRARGGTIGARGNHPFIGEYREIYLPGKEQF